MDFRKLIVAFKDDSSKMEFNLSVDCVIFTIQDERLKVLINKPLPHLGGMLPGNFMYKAEDASVAAHRILKQRTGADNIYLNQFKIFSSPDRFSFKSLFSLMRIPADEQIEIPRLPERVISIGFFALVNFESMNITVGDLHEETLWADVRELPELLFDHQEIIEQALEALRKELHFKPIAYKLLPEKFTMPELQKLYEIILDKPIERSSFQRKMLKWGIYERLEERREGVSHKRPYLYRFDQGKYEQAQQESIRFGV